jgi:hypothetical protein
MSTMALADRLSFYMWPDARDQTKRLRALFTEMTPDPEAAAVAVQLWRHTLIHFGDPISFTDTASGVVYSWLLHWGEEHLPRSQHLTFTTANGVRVLAFGALHAIDDLNRLAADLFERAQNNESGAARLVDAHARLVARQSRDLTSITPRQGPIPNRPRIDRAVLSNTDRSAIRRPGPNGRAARLWC